MAVMSYAGYGRPCPVSATTLWCYGALYTDTGYGALVRACGAALAVRGAARPAPHDLHATVSAPTSLARSYALLGTHVGPSLMVLTCSGLLDRCCGLSCADVGSVSTRNDVLPRALKLLNQRDKPLVPTAY
eukprot:2303089-Rhodomonas_salina.3